MPVIIGKEGETIGRTFDTVFGARLSTVVREEKIYNGVLIVESKYQYLLILSGTLRYLARGKGVGIAFLYFLNTAKPLYLLLSTRCVTIYKAQELTKCDCRTGEMLYGNSYSSFRLTSGRYL